MTSFTYVGLTPLIKGGFLWQNREIAERDKKLSNLQDIYNELVEQHEDINEQMQESSKELENIRKTLMRTETQDKENIIRDSDQRIEELKKELGEANQYTIQLTKEIGELKALTQQNNELLVHVEILNKNIEEMMTKHQDEKFDDYSVTINVSGGKGNEEPPKDPLTAILERLNSLYGTEFGEHEKLNIQQIVDKASHDGTLRSQAQNNPYDDFILGF